MLGKRALALAMAAALLCPAGMAEATEAEALSAPVEAAVEETEVALGDWAGDAMPAAEADGEVLAAPVEEAPPEDVTGLESVGLTPDVETAVAAAVTMEGDIGASVHWSLTPEGLLTISGQGEVSWNSWAQACDTPVREVVVCEGITSLPDSCFYENETLEGVSLPTTLAGVGQETFSYCPNLKRVSMAGGVSIGDSAFYECLQLSELALPATLTTIGNRAFAYTGLKALALPAGVQRVGDDAFENVPLESLDLGSVVEIGNSAFRNVTAAEVTVPQSVLSVGDRAFAAYNGGLRRITFLGAPTLGAAVFNRYGEAVELHFQGGVPGFDPETFGGTDVVAFYPGDEGGWTPAVRQAYGGQPVWVDGRETPVPTGKRPKSDKLKAEKSGYDVSVMDNGDGTYTRVIPTGKGVAVEIYKRSTGKLIWKKTLKQELPLYGGFFGGEKFNFLVFGQTNYDESDRREVVRVVRYTKNWRRVDAAVVKGANTVEPFRAGNVAFAEHGNMLYLHTCHLMYKSSDGRNHQANLDIDVYVPSMQVTADQSQIGYFGTGYVSHSFEQYIINDGADVIQLDLGDAYPRAVAMYRVSGAAGSVARSSAYGTGLEVLPIAGAIGDNYTGVSLAGLEATSTCYVTAGVSDSQAGKYPEEPENIFVAAVNKDEFNKAGMTLRWLTHYKKKDKVSLSRPSLVKLGADSLLLLWTEGGEKVRYVFLDGAGNAASPIRSFAGMSTGGKPIVSGGQVNWVYNDGSRLRLASVAVDGALQAPEIKSFANTAKGIKLTWGKVKGAKGYYVYRRTEGKKWSKLATVKGKTSYVDKKAKAGKSYCYIVRAYKGKTLSGYSDIGRPVPRLTAPAKLKAKKASYWTRIDLSWEKVAGAEGYLVYRRVDNGKWTLYGNYYDTSTELYDWDVKSGKKYSYKVRARKGGFTSADSAATNPIKP